MSDTPKENSRPSPPPAKSPSAPPPLSEHERKARVFRYMAILFAAAFLLLLLAFLMQQRTNRQAIDELTESVNSIHNVVEDNEALRQQVATLEDDLDELNETYLDEVNRHQQRIYQDLQNRESILAMDYFWQLEQAYLRGQYSLCRELIEKLEQMCDYKDAPISDHLLTQNYFDEDRPSMAERYQEIKDAVG